MSPRKRSRSRGRHRGSRVNKPRSLSRKRSIERRREEAAKKRSRIHNRSQSCSPTRVEETVQKEELEELENIRSKLMAQINSGDSFVEEKHPENMEDGEISDSGDEEVQGIFTEKTGREPSKNADKDIRVEQNVDQEKCTDLRQKLKAKQDNRTVSESGGGGSDKENGGATEGEKKSKVREKIHLKKACLKEYSEEDIDNKLIPFKKRQFFELQYEEQKLKKQIERARSKSNTPVRTVSESSAHDVSDGKKSPIKLCLNLKDIVIEPPSSSSEETNVESVVLQEAPPTTSQQPVPNSDDNAVFAPPAPSPVKPVHSPSPVKQQATALDISHDLAMTDESESEPDSPIKRLSRSQFDSPLKRARSQLTASLLSPRLAPQGSPLDLSSPRMMPPTTPVGTKDPSSPLNISNILKSPMVAGVSLLSPHPSKNPDLSFSKAVTSTPSPATFLQKQVKDFPPLPPPSFLSPEKKTKKFKKRKLGRSSVASIENIVSK